jgi:hypothetical protein
MSETTKTATAAYCGRRFTTKNKLAHSWLIDGAELLYAKQLVSWAQIGEQFTVTTNEDGSSVFTGGDRKPQLLPEQLHPDRVRWIAEDARAERELSEHRLKRKLDARPTELERALAPIRALLREKMPHRDRAALIQHITSELWRDQ